MTEQNWFNVTTWAQRDWDAALTRFWDELYGEPDNVYLGYRYFYPFDAERIRAARSRLDLARADFRRRVLSWYWKLLTPMQLDGTECIPNSVAELLAEEWDLATH